MQCADDCHRGVHGITRGRLLWHQTSVMVHKTASLLLGLTASQPAASPPPPPCRCSSPLCWCAPCSTSLLCFPSTASTSS